MRRELQVLLAELENAHRDIEAQVSSRAVRFSIPTTHVKDQREFNDLITRFFWSLFCPEIDIKTHGHELFGQVFGQAELLLKREFGPNARIAACELAMNQTEGGLRTILQTLTRLLSAHWAKADATSRVDHFWRQTAPEQLIQDAKDYIHEYRHILPSDLSDGCATRLLADFRKVLEQHPKTVAEFRRIGRR